MGWGGKVNSLVAGDERLIGWDCRLRWQHKVTVKNKIFFEIYMANIARSYIKMYKIHPLCYQSCTEFCMSYASVQIVLKILQHEGCCLGIRESDYDDT